QPGDRLRRPHGCCGGISVREEFQRDGTPVDAANLLDCLLCFLLYLSDFLFGDESVGTFFGSFYRTPTSTIREEVPEPAAASATQQYQLAIANLAVEFPEHGANVATGPPFTLGHGRSLIGEALLRANGPPTVTSRRA